MGGAPKYAAVNVVIIKCELCSKVFVGLFFIVVYALCGIVCVRLCVSVCVSVCVYVYYLYSVCLSCCLCEIWHKRQLLAGIL